VIPYHTFAGGPPAGAVKPYGAIEGNGLSWQFLD
jgi:hypothetical protein